MSIALVGGRLIDVVGRRVVERATIVVEDGVISRCEAEGAVPDGVSRVIDLRGRTVLPGLIDTHVHVLTPARRWELSEADAALWGREQLEAALLRGVTTVRDLGSQYQAIFALQRLSGRDRRIPRVLAAGPAIAITGGHAWQRISVEADGPLGFALAVREQLKAGADVIKLMATGGAGTAGQSPRWVQASAEEFASAVEVAHGAGRPVVAHAHGTEGIRMAVLAGVDTIEHGVFLDDETVDLMLERGTLLSPTLSVYPAIARTEDRSIAEEHMVRKAIDTIEPHATSFRKALAAGVGIVLGTDCGPLYHPVGAVGLELRLWVDNGMSAMDAIVAATIAAARSCRIDADTGSIEVGKQADLVIVDGEPDREIGALEDVWMVVRGGMIVTEGDRG
ncbi:MAG: amidohydrolase family protein [Protaetiibacter sp.]